MFVLVVYRGEIPQNTDTCIGKPHVIPQLLTLLRSQTFDGLTFYKNLVVDQKIHIVLVSDSLSVEMHLKIIFP